MNPAILMLLMTNNYRGGIASIDQPDDHFDDDLSAGVMDWFAWCFFAIFAIIALGAAVAIIMTFKR